MGGVGSDGSALKRLNQTFWSDEFRKKAWLVLLKPHRHNDSKLTKVFQLCEKVKFSLSVDALGAVTAEFHENTGTAGLAADSVSLSMERFQASTVSAFVIYEFNHNVSLHSPRPCIPF